MSIVEIRPLLFRYNGVSPHVEPGKNGNEGVFDHREMKIRYNEFPKTFAHETGHLMGVQHAADYVEKDRNVIRVSDWPEFKQKGYNKIGDVFTVGEIHIPLRNRGFNLGDRAVWVAKEVEEERYPGGKNSIMYVGTDAKPQDIQAVIDFARANGRLIEMNKDALIRKYRGTEWTLVKRP